MTRFATLAAAALTATAALTGAASAQAYNTGDQARAALSRIVPNADVSALSNAEAVATYQAASEASNPAEARENAASLIRAYAE